MQLQLLKHLNIAEFATSVPARYAGRLLADLGAAVKTYRKEDGSTEELLSRFLDARKQVGTFSELAERAVVDSMIADSDAILCDGDDASVGSLLASLLGERPRVLLHCSTYGIGSPYGSLCSDELFLSALSGIASVTPEEIENRSDERPMQLYRRQASLLGGLTASVALLQAIRQARRTKTTQFIDFSVLDALNSVPIISQAAGFAGASLPNPPSLRPQTVPRGFLKCADGWLYTQGGDDNWLGWARVIGRNEWREAPWSDPAHREREWQTIGPVIEQWLAEHSADFVYRACQSLGITCFPVNSISQVLTNSQMVHREIVEDLQLTDGSTLRAPRTPIRVTAI